MERRRSGRDAGTFVTGSAGQANNLAPGCKPHLTGRGAARATIARRLAALRSLVRPARTLGQATMLNKPAAAAG